MAKKKAAELEDFSPAVGKMQFYFSFCFSNSDYFSGWREEKTRGGVS